MPGANVYLEGSSYGTASDENGRFSLINIRPGKYVLKVDMIGYKSVVMQDVSISVNRTFSLDIELKKQSWRGKSSMLKLTG